MYLPLPSADPTLPPSSFRPSDPNLPPFLLQTPPPPPPAPVTTLCIKVLTLSSPRVPYGIGCHYMLNIYLIFF